MTETQQNRPEF